MDDDKDKKSFAELIEEITSIYEKANIRHKTDEELLEKMSGLKDIYFSNKINQNVINKMANIFDWEVFDWEEIII